MRYYRSGPRVQPQNAGSALFHVAPILGSSHSRGQAAPQGTASVLFSGPQEDQPNDAERNDNQICGWLIHTQVKQAANVTLLQRLRCHWEFARLLDAQERQVLDKFSFGLR